jgi:hypothetical protein
MQFGGTVWDWEEIDATRSGSSGDLAKLFKNEGVKEPGVFAERPLLADATLMAREVIQNSWDAARELHHDFENRGKEVPEFGIRFQFRNLIGDAKRACAEQLGLLELKERAENLDRTKLGLGAHDCLDDLDSDEPLRILEICEQATTGMYGPWKGAKSKLYLALVSIGFTAKEEGAGGSYGYGKSGLIRGSAIRTVLAYTCFPERPDDPGITRRLLGMTYWGLHDIGEFGYTGFARFGKKATDHKSVVPFENREADEIAGALHLAFRSPAVVADLGTTFVLVEPTVDASQLCAAIERSWWPAIEERQFTAEVVTSDGQRLLPRPRKDPVLMSFIRSWEVATKPRDNSVSTELAKVLAQHKSLNLGQLGLVADPEDWSWPPGAVVDDEGIFSAPVEHRSLVALIRGPRMVVEYFNCGQAAPFVRGTFVADRDVDDLLRQTEPKAHDSWQPTASVDGIDPDAPAVANAILRRIKATVNQFRRALKPPTPRGDDIRLPVLEELFKNLLDGKGTRKRVPKPEPRLVSIHIAEQTVEPDPEAPDSIRLRAKVGYALSDNYGDSDEANVELGIRFAYVEDHGSGERVPLQITAPSDFEGPTDSGTFTGLLGRATVVFEAISGPYAPDWTGRLVATGEIQSEAVTEWGPSS